MHTRHPLRAALVAVLLPAVAIAALGNSWFTENVRFDGDHGPVATRFLNAATPFVWTFTPRRGGGASTTLWLAQWLAIAALGVGPVGAAFYAWDIGMKRGDIRVLGAASYATPLLSTAFLILAGFARPSAGIAIAALLIAGGGLIAAKDMLRKKNS